MRILINQEEVIIYNSIFLYIYVYTLMYLLRLKALYSGGRKVDMQKCQCLFIESCTIEVCIR